MRLQSFLYDIEGAGTDAARQAAFMNYLKREFVDKKGDIQQLVSFVPTRI